MLFEAAPDWTVGPPFKSTVFNEVLEDEEEREERSLSLSSLPT